MNLKKRALLFMWLITDPSGQNLDSKRKKEIVC
jgi:hypothetical protein